MDRKRKAITSTSPENTQAPTIIRGKGDNYEPNGTLHEELNHLKTFETPRPELLRHPEYKHLIKVCGELGLSL